MKVISKPRILFMDHSAELGGAELSLLDILTPPEQIRQAFEITAMAFYTGPFFDALRCANVRTHLLETPGQSFFKIRREGGLFGALVGSIASIKTAARLIPFVQNYDLIYCNSQKSFVVGALLGFFSNKKVIWHLRDILSPAHFSSVQIKLITCFANRFAVRVIANSQATRQAFIDAGGRPSLPVVIYNGIDAPSELVKTHLPPELKHPILGCFGRISPWKGQALAINTLSQLSSGSLLIVGAALFGETDYESQIHELVKKLGLQNRVHFLGFQKNIWGIMKECDYILHTSTEPEPFGRVLVEGMLSQKVVFAPDVGGPLEILSHLKTGVFYTPGSDTALAQAISELELNLILKSQIETNAKLSAQSRFSRSQMIQNVYQEISKHA